MKTAALRFDTKTVDEFTIRDERSFRGLGLYNDLKAVLQRARYPFRVLPRSLAGRWDRALLLNLTYWGAEAGGDVLVDELEPDVVAHAAWHHLAAKALPATNGVASAASLFLGESIASAFDVYLVGRLLRAAPKAAFLESQVPAMANAAMGAGLPEKDFEAMLMGMAESPEGAFEDLRELLYDATTTLYECNDAESAMVALGKLDGHRFAPILHHYELSNWVLYARAYAKPPSGERPVDERARELDHALREAKDGAIDWLAKHWLV